MKFKQWAEEIKAFSGSDPNEGLKNVLFNSLLALPINTLVFWSLWRLYNFNMAPIALWEALAFMVAGPLFMLEVLYFILGLKEGKILSLLVSLNGFLLFSWIYYGYQKILMFFASSLERLFEREEADEEWGWGNTYPQYTCLSIPQQPADFSFKTLDLWKMVGDVKIFVKEHFTDSQSLTRFMKERLQRPGESSLDMDFLYFSLLIPKRKELSIEGIKNILLAYPGIKNNPYYEKLPRFLTNNDLLSKSFKHYSESDLKKLFCRRYHAQDFFDMILKLVKTPIELPVMDNFKELNTFLSQNLVSGLHHPVLTKLHNQCVGEFKLTLLSTEEDYILWARKLENCIQRSYWDLEEVDIIGIYRGRQFYGALSFRLGNFEQIKGFKNYELNKEDVTTIMTFIQQKLEIKIQPNG